MLQHLAVRPTDRVLDLGCGYGAVGVVAGAFAPEGHVTLVDINERAVELAARESRRQQGHERRGAPERRLREPRGREFDLIALNPPIRAGLMVVHRLIEEVGGAPRARRGVLPCGAHATRGDPPGKEDGRGLGAGRGSRQGRRLSRVRFAQILGDEVLMRAESQQFLNSWSIRPALPVSSCPAQQVISDYLDPVCRRGPHST